MATRLEITLSKREQSRWDVDPDFRSFVRGKAAAYARTLRKAVQVRASTGVLLEKVTPAYSGVGGFGTRRGTPKERSRIRRNVAAHWVVVAERGQPGGGTSRHTSHPAARDIAKQIAAVAPLGMGAYVMHGSTPWEFWRKGTSGNVERIDLRNAP